MSLLLLLLLLSGPVQPVELQERVAVRAALPDDEDVAAFSTTVALDDARARGAELADVLRRVPGARVRDYGGFGRFATVTLRGSTAEQVTVLVDGVPQNRSLGGPVDLSSIPLSQVAEVHIFRGFAPAALGLGGIGGVIDVRTNRPEGGRGRIDLLGGELGTRRASGSWSHAAGKRVALRAGFEWLASDGDFRYLDTRQTPFNPGDDFVRRRANNDVEQSSLTLQLLREEAGPGRLQARLRLQQSDEGLPGPESLPAADVRLQDELAELGLSWDWRREGRWSGIDLDFDAFRQRLRLDDPRGEIGVGSQRQRTTLHGAGLAAVARGRLGAHRLLLRAELRHERAGLRDAALGVPDRGGARRELAAVTMEDVVTAGGWTIAPSMRLERWDDRFIAGAAGLVAPPASDRSDEGWAAKIGLARPLGKRVDLRASVGRFHRRPNLLELFGDRGAIAGNPALRPEAGLAAEAGVSRESRSRRRPWRFEALVFARRTDDLIWFRPNSQGVAIARNLARTDNRGVELAGSVGLPGGLSVDLSWTAQRPRDVSDGPDDGNPLPFQPDLLGYAGLRLNRGPWQASWELTYTGRNSFDSADTPAFRIPERWIHDAALERNFDGGWRAGIDLRNLFDRRALDVARYPLPGRTLLAHVGWSSAP